MKINLIKKRTYNKLLSTYNKYPCLSLQNKGYETINTDNFSTKEKEAYNQVSEILAESIYGFRSFQNFRLSKNGSIEIRIQYNYNYDDGIPFIGVGYLLLDELIYGFKN